MRVRVGVLALQGDVEEHKEAFLKAGRELGVDVELVEVKKPQHLDGLRAIAIPGGESTTIGILAKRTGLLDALKSKIEDGLPTLGTCAGLIMLAKEVKDSVVGPTGQPILGVLDASVLRNAFGRQRESFELDLDVEEFGRLRAVFIRAPVILRTWGNARPLARLRHGVLGDVIVAVMQDNIIGLAFHPELTTTIVHKRLIEIGLGKA